MRTMIIASLLAAACGAPQQVRVQTPEEALSADAASLARDVGVSQAEAARRLRAQAALGDHLARLREAHRARVAGIYYQSAPDFRVIVRLKGDAPVAANALNESPVAGVPIEFRTGAAHSMDELLALQETHRAEIAAIEGLQGYGPDERTGAILLDVYAPDHEAETRAQAAALEALLGAPVVVNFAPAPVELQ